jgi:DNA-binding Xre family transcriptional regulator
MDNERALNSTTGERPPHLPRAQRSRPRFDAGRSAQKTKLGRLRIQRELSQRELELASGIPIRTLQRLEAGQLENPALAYLVNLAVVLGVFVEDIVEDSWLVFNEQVGCEDWEWAHGDPRGRRAHLCWHHAGASPK